MLGVKKDQPGTRQKLLETACRVFAEKGYRGATVAEICDEAGANIASVNYHFGDKARLYEEVWRHAFEEGRRAYPVEPAMDRDLPAEERLRLLVHVLLNRTLTRGMPGYYARLQIREMVEPTCALEAMVRDVVIPHRRMLFDLIQELLGKGAPLPVVDMCVFSIASQCLFLGVSEPVRQELVRQDAFRDQSIAVFANHIADFSLAGLVHFRQAFGGGDP
jgi:AcrR family transcriptional regulator